MDDAKALQAILDKLNGLEAGQIATNDRLAKIEGRLSKIEEDSNITRSGVNTLLDWAEKVEVQVSIPLFPKERD